MVYMMMQPPTISFLTSTLWDINIVVSFFLLFYLQTVMLVIAWKLQAATMGFFTFHEWSKGMLSIE